MVFESIVVDLLNRILGSYFENLDTSQLKLGIWGGDAVLRDLVLKTSAMDDLGLPFKVVIGKLGNLTMRIPWQSLYTAPVELDLKNLYLLVVPSYAVAYNEEQEEIAIQARKQAELARIDELRKHEQLKKAGTAEAPPPDTFSEKLITQIIKNVQIRIESIHIRYEDAVTLPKTPFAFGTILKHLNVQTTDDNWKLAIITETVNVIHKLAKLEGLSVYWNSNTAMISQLTDKAQMLQSLQECVTKDLLLTHVLGPISSEGKIKLTPSPEKLKFAQSKFVVDVDMKELAIGLTNRQFQDAMSLAEAMDFMQRAQHYRKYRPPFTEHKGHYKEWWKFAYRCIVEEDVRRRQLNWDWQHIKHHRQLVKVYAEVYYQKLTNTNKKQKLEIDAKILQCEKALDVFNITLVRKQVEVRVDRQVKKEPEKPTGWFSGWFGGGTTTTADTSTSATADIAKKFEEALTQDEKAKLYDAIDYTEGAAPVDYPHTYLAYLLQFHLHKLRCIIRDVSGKTGALAENILDLQIANVEHSIATRPFKNGLKLDLKMGSIEAVGVQRAEHSPPFLISSQSTGVGGSLVEASFETNPLATSASQKVAVRLAPVEIVYHSKTIIELVRCFTLPAEMQLSKLQAATVATINQWREQSAAGLQYLIDTRGEIDIDIHFLAPYFLIPQGGSLAKKGSVLVFDLGEISVKSKPRVRERIDKSEQAKKTKDEIRQDVIDKSYDTFLVTLQDFQVLLALPGDNFREAIQKSSSRSKAVTGMELIKSQQFVVQLDQCLVQDDPQLPKIKVSATLPLLDLVITENRCIELLKLLVTLPFPQSAPPTGPTVDLTHDAGLAESVAVTRIAYTEMEKKDFKSIAQFTEAVLTFTVSAIQFRINRVQVVTKSITPLAEFELKNLVSVVTQKTFSLGIDVSVGGLSLIASSHSAPGIGLGQLYLLRTPMNQDHLFKLDFFSISSDCPPKFAAAVKQSIKCDVSTLDLILHQEALHTLLSFTYQILESFQSALEVSDSVSVITIPTATASTPYITKKEDKKQLSRFEATRKAVAKKHHDSKDILLKVGAHLHRLTVQLSTEHKNILRLVLGELDVSFEQTPKKSIVTMELTEFDLFNLDPLGFYRKIISQEHEKVIYVKCMMVQGPTAGPGYHDTEKFDMKLHVETGSPRIVYLNPFLEEVMGFIDKFQAAKDAVVEASSAAAEMAKEGVEQAYSTGTRALINIVVKSPQVIIPRNAQSSTGFIAYLGNLSIRNSFREMSVEGGGYAVIIDDIQTVLNEMKMSRFIMDRETQRQSAECSILDPVTLALHIQRNMAAEAHPEIPAIQINGSMGNTSIRCSNEDYMVLMASLTENISNKGTPEPSSKQEPLTKVDVKTKALVSRRPSRIRRESEGSKTGEVTTLIPAKKDERVICNFRLEFSLATTSVVLYEGSSHLEGKLGVIERNGKTAFAKFTIARIDQGVTMFTNGNMVCSTGIGNISLEDIRPGERQITNLIHRRAPATDSSPVSQSLISVSFRVEQPTGTTLNVEITGMTFVLCLEYLYRLVGFFTSADPAKVQLEQDAIGYQEFNIAGEPGPVREITPPKVAAEGEGKPGAEPFRIFVTMGETDLILVETVERLDTNGLLLNCELSMRQTIDDGKTNLMCAMNKIRLSTCKYDPGNRGSSLAEVISPMSITLVMNTTVEGMQIDVNISDIFIRLTAGTLELLISILSTSFQTGNAEKGGDAGIDWSHIWNMKSNRDSKFWFLDPQVNVELGMDALSSPEDTARLFDQVDEIVRKERLVLESGCIVLTFETGAGTNTTPILLIESDIDMQAFDWSQKLQMTGRMKLEAAYYNVVYGMWEFLVEPVETRHHGKVSHRPWELYFEYTTMECLNARNRGENSTPSGEDDGDFLPDNPDKVPTYMSISLQSNDILELTLTKTALDVVTMLTADFNEAVKSLVSQKEVMTSPYAVTNDLGVDIKLDFRGSPFTLVRKGQVYEEALLKPGTSLNLTLAETFDMTTRHTSILKEQEGREERLLRVIIDEFEFMAEIPVNRADRRYYPLKKSSHGLHYALLCDTQVNGTSKVVTIRSVVQIVNHLKVSVDIYYMSEDGNSVVSAGSAEGGKTLNVPINCLYTRSSELYFAPAGYNLSSLACVWTTLLKDPEGFSNQLQCRIKLGEGSEFHLKVIGDVKETLYEGTNRISATSRCCTIHLKAPLIINNMLPVPLDFSLSEIATSVRSADKGHSMHVTDMAVDKNKELSICLKIPSYENQSWKSSIEINKSTPELSPWLFTSVETPTNTLYLGIHKDTTDESLTLHIYSPFWMVNRTGLTLAYHVRDSSPTENLLMNLCHFCAPGEQAEDHKDMTPLVHPPHQNPLLFSFRGKSFFAKKKAVVRVEGETDWSTKFPVDVAGSCGSVTCKSPIMDFEIGIEILLTGWGLTKTIIFTPRYYLINQCSYIVEVTEAEKEGSKIKILPNTCTPFWPKSQTAQLVLRIDNTNEFSKRFSYEKSDEILLQLGNKYGGVHVDVHITEASHLLTFTEFTTGHAAVLIVNHTTDSPIEIWDKGVGESRRRVGPGMNELMTWQDPMGEKAISWSPVGLNTSFQDRLNGDGFGSYTAPNENGVERQYHWLSFLDGLQRVMLFTTDKNLVSTLQASRDIEVPTAEYSLMFHGLGISLVNTASCQEILYMRIASSEVIWESQKPGKRQRFKPIPLRKSSIIEYAYQNYLNEKVVNSNVKSHVTLDAGMEVDFVDLKMFKPYDRVIRRMFQTGLWIHYKTYPHTILLHAKLNRIQIDNQLPDCIFRIVLAPVPPPKSVSSDIEGQKPFAEVSIMERIIEHSSVVQFKYFKVLIQEFQIKMDIHFVNALVGLFSEESEKRLERMVEYFDKDYAEATTDFNAFLDRHVVSQGQKNFYDFLHFSPLKIHLSFSMGGATQVSNTFLNLLIASLGVSVTEVQDVVFKLACMELQHLFLTRDQLYSEAYSHYTSQALRQLYVLVLGLDVIGNPYGLILGFSQGVGAFFYEPFHGAIQGPGEFMEGLALGVKSLFGHTIGGMSGAMSKITGTFGKGVAALTLDDEYQKKRRENLSKRQTAGEGFVESGKDLVMGFVDGLTGVFMQPVRGAKKDGVEGFFKGLGKGAIGLVTRPAAGVIDFTSGSFDAVKKATSVSDETRRMRPPRYIPPNNALQPYVLHEAEGMTLFTELEKGKYAATDTYIAHALVNPHGIYVILLTNRRVLYLKKIDIFGGWGVQWTSMWEELDGPPDIVENGLSFRIKTETTKRNLLRCQSKATQVVIPLYSPDVATWLLEKIDEAMRREMGVAVGEDALQQPISAGPGKTPGQKVEPKAGTSKEVPPLG